jgi:hypothetical protein
MSTLTIQRGDSPNGSGITGRKEACPVKKYYTYEDFEKVSEEVHLEWKKA